MDNIIELEHCFKQYWNQIKKWLPEGIVQVDLKLLLDFGLLDFEAKDSSKRIFHVIETPDKILLVNQDFVVWIVPFIENGISVSYTLIALNGRESLHPEICFKCVGAYNTSHLVLSILDKYINEIEENEIVLTNIQNYY